MINFGDNKSEKPRRTAAGAKYLLKRARRRARERAGSRPWIGFHRWKALNNAPWDSGWMFGRWAAILLVLPLIPVVLGFWLLSILASALLILENNDVEATILGVVLLVISTSPVWYYFWNKSDDYGAGEPLAPSKREAFRRKRAERLARRERKRSSADSAKE